MIQPLFSGGKDERRRDHKTRAPCDIEGSSSGPGSGWPSFLGTSGNSTVRKDWHDFPSKSRRYLFPGFLLRYNRVASRKAHDNLGEA